MKWLSRIITLFLFVFFFVLALKNTQETALHFFLGYEIQGPFVIIVLCFFVAGLVLGLLAMLPSLFRGLRERSRQKKRITELEQALATLQELDNTLSAPLVPETETT